MEHLFHLDITNGLFTIVCSNCGSKLIKVTHDNCGNIKSCTCTKCSATMTRKENVDNIDGNTEYHQITIEEYIDAK